MPDAFVPPYPHRLVTVQGQRLVEVRVGGGHGYAYLTEEAHDRILGSARGALGYRQAVLRAAILFAAHPHTPEADA